MIKRGKIKDKYLHYDIDNKNGDNAFDRAEGNIFNFLKFIGVLLLLLTGSGIFRIILEIWGFDIENMNNTYKVFLSLGGDLVLLAIFILVYRKCVKKDFIHYFCHDFGKNFTKSFAFFLVGLLIMICGNLFILIFTKGALSANEKAVRELIGNYPIYMLFQIAIFAPITEELVFRKGISDFVHNKCLYIFLSGFIFGFLHVISSVNQDFWFLYLIPYCSLGFLFASIYKDTDNIFTTIVIHSLHNVLSFVLYFI